MDRSARCLPFSIHSLTEEAVWVLGDRSFETDDRAWGGGGKCAISHSRSVLISSHFQVPLMLPPFFHRVTCIPTRKVDLPTPPAEVPETFHG